MSGEENIRVAGLFGDGDRKGVASINLENCYSPLCVSYYICYS